MPYEINRKINIRERKKKFSEIQGQGKKTAPPASVSPAEVLRDISSPQSDISSSPKKSRLSKDNSPSQTFADDNFNMDDFDDNFTSFGNNGKDAHKETIDSKFYYE